MSTPVGDPLAPFEALLQGWTTATCQTDGAPCSWHRVSAECAAELRAALAEARALLAQQRPEPGLCWNDSGVTWPDGFNPRCELRAGHAGAHESNRNGRGGQTVWLDDEQRSVAVLDEIESRIMDQESCDSPRASRSEHRGCFVGNSLQIVRDVRNRVAQQKPEPTPPAPDDLRERVVEALLASWTRQGALDPPFDSDREDALQDADAVLVALGAKVKYSVLADGRSEPFAGRTSDLNTARSWSQLSGDRVVSALVIPEQNTEWVEVSDR
ncbi:hypothetical protein [Nocardioides sp. R-C-SC26]|uniref:hypothetical protein n=1 Tax=Nocardioides sp. R-C-SC26 TaxID=2870414 RepID=UPI001E4843B9|nr:hypothetical protein [Nocardioides sp. R-C-SC26]